MARLWLPWTLVGILLLTNVLTLVCYLNKVDEHRHAILEGHDIMFEGDRLGAWPPDHPYYAACRRLEPVRWRIAELERMYQAAEALDD